MSTLAQDFNVGVIYACQYNRTDVTFTWDSEIPMEFRLHMWEPADDGERVEVITSVSRDLLTEATDEQGVPKGRPFGMGDVTASRVRFPGHPASATHVVDWVHLHLATPGGVMTLTIPTPPLAALVRASLHKCPPESEALDVDGLISKIFNAEEADN